MMMTIWRMTVWEKLNPSVHQKRIGGRIANELLMLLRSRRKISREVSLYDPIGTDKEGNEISLLDIIEGEAVDVAEQMDLRSDTERLRCLFDQVLTERERRVLTMRYGIGGVGEKTQREIAQICGISRSYVSRIEKGAIRKLREGFCARTPRGRE